MSLVDLKVHWRDVYPANLPVRLGSSNSTSDIKSFHEWLHNTYWQRADALGRTVISQQTLRRTGQATAVSSKGVAKLRSLFKNQGAASAVRDQLVPEQGLQVLFALRPDDRVCTTLATCSVRARLYCAMVQNVYGFCVICADVVQPD